MTAADLHSTLGTWSTSNRARRAVTPYLKARLDGRPSRLGPLASAPFRNSMIDSLLHRTHPPTARRAISRPAHGAPACGTRGRSAETCAEMSAFLPIFRMSWHRDSAPAEVRLAILSPRSGYAERSPSLGSPSTASSRSPSGQLQTARATYRPSPQSWRPPGGTPVRGEPRLRPRGRQGNWYARCVCRPPQAAVRRLAIPAGSRRRRLQGARRTGWMNGGRPPKYHPN